MLVSIEEIVIVWRQKDNKNTCIEMYLLLTGTEGDGKSVLTELNTSPQILSTHTWGEPPDWLSGLSELVAQGIEIQSVLHSVFMDPTDPSEPTILNDMGSGIFTAKGFKNYVYPLRNFNNIMIVEFRCRYVCTKNKNGLVQMARFKNNLK